jgi:hypothetical protein
MRWRGFGGKMNPYIEEDSAGRRIFGKWMHSSG